MHIHIDSPVAKSPTATDSLLLTRRQLRPTGRQSQASTRASSPSHQDPACGLDSTPIHTTSTHRSPTATYKSPSTSASPGFYAQVVNQDPACGLVSTPYHIDSPVAKSPTTTDSLLLTRRQSQASTQASSPSNQDVDIESRLRT